MSNQIRNFSFLLVGVIIILFVASYFVTSSIHSEENRESTSLKVKGATELSHKSFEWTEEEAEDQAVVELASLDEEVATEVAFRQFPTKTVVATGYTAGYESTGKTEGHPLYGVTYSGLDVQRETISTIAADLNVFPLGTVLYIPEYGYGIVTDIGGAITGNKIDLYYETVDEVFNQWGKREIDVYVIEEGDGQVSEDDLIYWEEAIQSEAVPVIGGQYY
ncbi:3D domain-containing protein [Alkalibacillus silvisoli]|uniref:Stationary phase survival protein SpsC n=1 Tax=Alkalibacillus silvisoli TaxID=392823 RepID=A0ABP3JWH5_9BACI